MSKISRTISVLFVFMLLFSFQCQADVTFIDPFTGETTDQPVPRAFTSECENVYFDIGRPGTQLKLYLEALIPEESDDANVFVGIGPEGGAYGQVAWN